jgi:hypothetical protein
MNDEILVGGDAFLPGGFSEPQKDKLVESVVVESFGHSESFPVLESNELGLARGEI